jgi:hypothetical protein
LILLLPDEKGQKKMVSEETRKRISESNKGQKRTEEARRKMSEAQKKRYEDPEERSKIGDRSKGKNIQKKPSGK